MPRKKKSMVETPPPSPLPPPPQEQIQQEVSHQQQIQQDQQSNDAEISNDILQLHLSDDFIKSVIDEDNTQDSTFPSPYERVNNFETTIETDCNPQLEINNLVENTRSVCFWCCHSVVNFCGHMPLNYNYATGNFKVYGVFCSFPCMSAYNFSVNSKSDKLWQINTLINMLANRYGYNENIRPAPSRYLLKMFGGTMDIEEFRNCHKNYERSHIMNIPPMICISGTPEVINTSYVNKVAKK
tara:strand:+ start:5096 stop:5818 length:723 start_codon:yes stop_codon:yes gene_type:complete